MKSENQFLFYSIAIIIFLFGFFLILLPSSIPLVYSEGEGEFEGDLSIIDTRYHNCVIDNNPQLCKYVFQELYTFSGGLSLGISSPQIGTNYHPSPPTTPWATCSFVYSEYLENGQLYYHQVQNTGPFLAMNPSVPNGLFINGILTIEEEPSPSISSNNVSSMATSEGALKGFFDFRTQPFLLVCDDDIVSINDEGVSGKFPIIKQTDGTLTASGGYTEVSPGVTDPGSIEYKSNWNLKIKSTNCRTSPVFNFLQSKTVEIPFTANTLQEALPNLLKAIGNAQIHYEEPGSGNALGATVVPKTDKDQEKDGKIIKCIRNYEIQVISLIPQWTNVNQFCTKVQDQWIKDRDIIINHEKKHANDNILLVKKFLDQGKFTFPKLDHQYIQEKILFNKLRALNKIIEHAIFQPGTEFNADQVKC